MFFDSLQVFHGASALRVDASTLAALAPREATPPARNRRCNPPEWKTNRMENTYTPLESALLQFAKAFQALNKGRDKVARLTSDLKKTVQTVFDAGGRPKDCFAVLESQEIGFNSDTIESYFARLTPADKKQNTGKTANPAAEKGRKAMAETQGGESATSATIAVDAACAFAAPFIARAITESDKDGNPSTAKASASDADKCQANINLAIAMQKGLRAASTAAAKLVTARQAEAKVLGRAKVEAAKVEANAKADKATASKATGRRKGKAKAKKADKKVWPKVDEDINREPVTT